MKQKVKRITLIVSIFVVAIGGAFGLSQMKPPPETKDAADIDILVDVLSLDRTVATFTVRSQGTVRPRTETILSAEVSGAIVSISPKFIAGGVFSSGEELMRIDPTDYAVAVDQAEALLKQRQIEFDGAEKLKTQGYRAESEWASAAAALASARADLVKAGRNLERTHIRLPYDGMVRSKEADLGQYVNPGTRLGVTFATDYAEVRLPLTDQDLAFIELPDPADIAASGTAEGPPVSLSAVQQGRTAHWEARIVRTEGVVDERNRVTYAVAQIADPYQLQAEDDFHSPLPIGSFVAASIEGLTVEDVIRVPRSALRGNDQLMFVDDEDRLHIRSVDVLRADADYAYLRGGAMAGERISLTAIESPINGMKVRTGREAAEDTTERLASGDATN
ncbi:MAG: efflux RND transporter periplasmic adaptor subunit [Woeseia sp.]